MSSPPASTLVSFQLMVDPPTRYMDPDPRYLCLNSYGWYFGFLSEIPAFIKEYQVIKVQSTQQKKKKVVQSTKQLYEIDIYALIVGQECRYDTRRKS